jgi:hypothetical protein
LTDTILETSKRMKKPLDRPKCRWEDNIEVDLKGIVYEDVDLIHLGGLEDSGELM